MNPKVKQMVDILRQTPGTLRSMLSNLSEFWIMQNEGPDTWSPFDIVGAFDSW